MLNATSKLLPQGKSFQIFFLFLLAMIVGLIFFQSPGTTDVDIWRSWTKNADSLGMVDGFRANHADYPPLASAILLTGYRIFDRLGFSMFEAIKLTILVFLLQTSLIFWLWTRDSYLTLVLYASLLVNSVGLGYIDIFFAPSLVGALWMLKERRWIWFSVFFALTFMTKWQPVLIAPFIALYVIEIQHPRQWRQIDIKRLVMTILPGAAILGILLLIFKSEPIWLAFKASLSHEYLSGNALNFNWILTHFIRVFRPEQFGGLNHSIADLIITNDPKITTVPHLLFYFSYLATLIVFFFREKTFKNLLIYSIIGFLAYFTFNTGVHENHLFLVMILVAGLIWVEHSAWRIGLVLILVNNINLFIFYGIDGNIHFPRPVFGTDIALLLAVFNVSFFFYLFVKAILPPFRKVCDNAQ